MREVMQSQALLLTTEQTISSSPLLTTMSDSRNSTSTVYDAVFLRFPRIEDPRGNLTFVEQERHIPFKIARAYWIYDVPGGEKRGGHAYRTQEECIIALSGSVDVFLDDGRDQKIVTLNRAYCGLYVPRMLWRRMQSFSTNSVAYVLASCPYSKSDYVRDYRQYKQMTTRD